MAKRSLAALAEQFKQKASTEGSSNADWKKFFNFWKADVDTTSTIRFLPDLDETNTLGFLVENLSHELVVNGKRERVPCLKMYGEDCPICELSQKYYDEKSPEHNEALGKKYYRKKSYIGQCVVIDTPIEHDADQIVKLIELGPAIFKNIQAAFQSGDLEEAPFELKGGYNFRIKKTKSGEYASYNTSSFSPKQTDLDDELISKLSLYNLADFRTARVSREELEAMLVADQTGGTHQASAPAPAPTAKSEDSAPTPAAAPAAPSAGSSLVEQLRAKALAAKQAQADAE